MKRPVIIADSAIPYLRGVFEPYAEVHYCGGRDFASCGFLYSSDAAADALIIRTRTVCNERLLRGSGVRLIATATIGEDHIDTGYCKVHGIKVISAPGCNSGAVMQYVMSAIYALKPGINPQNTVIGVIGAGNVGEKVARLAQALGFGVLRNDPPKELQQKKLEASFHNGRPDGLLQYYPLEHVLANSDIVTLHVPLDATTRGMAGTEFLSKMRPGAMLINASRGEVVVDEAVMASSRLGEVVLDVWNGEPAINRELLGRSALATPHIAGYSIEGKQNGTTAVVRGVADFFGIEPLREFTAADRDERPRLNLAGGVGEQLKRFFDIKSIDSLLRSAPERFEQIRTDYLLRHEFVY